MIRIYLILSLFSLNNLCFGEIKPISADYRDKIVKAIFIAEGGNKTKYPYGIKSIKTSNPKKICENTVSNNYIRWQRAGKTNDFIIFLADKYCPQSVDYQGNINWKKNVKKLVDNPR